MEKQPEGVDFFAVRRVKRFLKLFSTPTLTQVWRMALRQDPSAAQPAVQPPAHRSDLIAGLTRVIQRDGHRHLTELPRLDVLRSVAIKLGLPLVTTKKVECKKRIIEYLDSNGLDFMLDRLDDEHLVALSEALGIQLRVPEGGSIDRQGRNISIRAAVNSAGLHAFMDPLLPLPLFDQMVEEAGVALTDHDGRRKRKDLLEDLLTEPVPQPTVGASVEPMKTDEKAQATAKPAKRKRDEAKKELGKDKEKKENEAEPQHHDEGLQKKRKSDDVSASTSTSTSTSTSVTDPTPNEESSSGSARHFKMFALVKNEAPRSAAPAPAPQQVQPAGTAEAKEQQPPQPVVTVEKRKADEVVEAPKPTGNEEVREALHELGLGEYIPQFESEKVDKEALLLLEDEHLKLLGMPMGHRLKLLKKIAALKSEETPAEKTAKAPAAATTDTAQANKNKSKSSPLTPGRNRRRISELKELQFEARKWEQRDERRNRRRSLNPPVPPLPDVGPPPNDSEDEQQAEAATPAPTPDPAPVLTQPKVILIEE